MYKVILVDDETRVRESICALLDWEGLGLRLLGSCENALDALQLMDLDWSGLRAIDPGLVTYDATAPERVVERAKDAEILLVNKVKLTREVLEQLPALRYVGVLATGYDNVDCAAAREKGVVVTNVPGYSTDSVAQLVFALLLELCHQIGHHSDTVKAGRWANQPYYCYWDSPLIELAGKTMGIFGLGKIGRRTAQIAQAFGMKVIACSRTKKDAPGVTWVGFDELLRESDVLYYASLGYSSKAIGESLFVAPGTVQSHTKRVYAKLGVHSKQELIELVNDAQTSST